MNSEFTIPMEMISLNEYINAERSNKFIAAKIKKESTEISKLYSKSIKLDREKQYDLEIHWHTKDKRKDSDGVFFSVKFILDGITDKKDKLGNITLGILPNDTYRYIRNIFNYRYIGESKVMVKFIEVE